MASEEKRYILKNSQDILKSVGSFCNYYHLIKKYIDLREIKSSLDRGAFARPQFMLNREIYYFLGQKRDKLSYAYGPEIGDVTVREKICKVENLKHKTSYLPENIAIVAGAWSGVELVIEELADLRKGKTKDFTVAVIGPTHYQMFHRAINMLGVNVVGFDFVKPSMGSTPKTTDEIDDILKINPNAIFVTNPNNPNGEYFPSKLLKYLIEICQEKNIYVIIDEIQDFFISDKLGLNYSKWVQSPNVIRIDSFSKKRGIAEYRVGWVIADKKILGDRLTGVIGRLSGLMGNAPRAANTIICKLLDLEEKHIKTGIDYFKPVETSLKKRENYIIERLKSMPGVEILPRGACINLTVKIKYPKTDFELSSDLMNNGTLIMPCGGYGYAAADVIMRITFAERWKKLQHSMNALKSVLISSQK
ncbi:hypothetical protein COU01_04515 [Candidatus Falkowbacteria bacterium CG10_big_fil_rev_8_21_14_0_10_44_15]|uniref:Aminotransferase class I/classII large domain-containing protein n=1 Tax=Candidatus Falkowbacteria bacterium CG10_big_fil_rev_8_21_14_0_10_44_15 TaxID=1974569 RepID=A0A2H0UYQ9_9BACT|nr:MAG: hypothetical protein COU01_04515 [Candidatus Falkowbacteria bacterium CG10_big_fil_rev_8_21_14_0_10_44_15]